MYDKTAEESFNNFLNAMSSKKLKLLKQFSYHEASKFPLKKCLQEEKFKFPFDLKFCEMFY